MIYGVDIHPEFQRGISIEQIAAEGFEFLSVKLSESLSSGWMGMGAEDWIRRGKAAGLVCFGYHFLRPVDITGQARVFAAALDHCDVHGVIDAEATVLRGGVNVPTLSIDMIRQFHSELLKLGARVPLMYLPKWYWQSIGSPDLTGLPSLWASSYPSTQQAPASVLYEAVTPSRWTAYGGLPVGVLQFADTALVSGMAIDANVFPGTRADLISALSGSGSANLLGADDMTPDEMITKVLAADDKRWDGRNVIDMLRQTVASVLAIQAQVNDLNKKVDALTSVGKPPTKP